MPRRPRVHDPGSFHHVTTHGVDARPLFADDADRWKFVGTLGDVTREIGWRCVAFCLMDTHYHLLLQERDVPLWRGMRLLNGRYATAHNKRHERVGCLFRSRYRDRPVGSDGHLLAAIRYIALNPVEVNRCASPSEWPWSSYGQLVGVARGWSFVSAAWTLSLFSPRRDEAIERVRRYVEQVPGT